MRRCSLAGALNLQATLTTPEICTSMYSHNHDPAREMNWKLVAGVSLPLATAISFITIYALATPLTDEWLMVRNAMLLKEAPESLLGLLATMHHMRWFIYEHPIVIPNLIYLIFMPHVHYDTRFLVGITLLCFLVMVLAVYWRTKGSSLATIATALIVFSPAHYMEYFWGFQFAFAMSTSLAVVGLVIVDRGASAKERYSIKIILGFLIIGLGLLCSAGAAFAFLAASILALNTNITQNRRILITSTGIILFVASVVWRHGNHLELSISSRNVLMIMTSLGSVLYSSPVGVSAFRLDARCIAGGVFVILDLLLIASIMRKERMRHLALPCSLIFFSVSMIGAITLSRNYIGNWHLQLTLPLFIGSAMLVPLALEGRSPLNRAIAILLLALVASSVFGYIKSFEYYGPAYHAYAERVTQYMRTLPRKPDQPKPFPETGGWDATPKMVQFLEAAGNPEFK
jgi:hypothetical protein